MKISMLQTAIGCVVFLGLCAAGNANGAETSTPAARAEGRFQEAQRRYYEQPTSLQAAVKAAQTAFDWAEFASRDAQRADIAQFGIAAGKNAVAASPTNAAAHYWLGMNYAQLARTKSLGALRLVRDMETELLRAVELDGSVDFAGPHRILGLLYRDAPGWPTSVGSKKKARQHLERSVQIAPEFPENHLSLLETYEEWGEKENLARHLPATQTSLDKARQTFTGEEWEEEWSDWEKRMKKFPRR